MSTVTAPVAGFAGTVAGVKFTDGQAETTDERALAYFRRKGYEVDGHRREQAMPPMPPDPRFITTQRIGTPMRDASVDPRPGDRPVFSPRRTDGRPHRTPPAGVTLDDAGRVLDVDDA